MNKFSKDTAIKFIIQQLSKVVSKEDILRQIATNCDKDRATIYRWYSDAEKKYLKDQEPIVAAANEQLLSKEISGKIRAINERNRRLAILTRKFDELNEVKEKIVKVQDKSGKVIEHKITKMDYLKTIEVMTRLDERISKAEGTDAPSKTALTDSDGNDVKKTISSLESATLEQLEKIVKMGTK